MNSPVSIAPQKNGRHLEVVGFGQIQICLYSDNIWRRENSLSGERANVTHWMKLPELPRN